MKNKKNKFFKKDLKLGDLNKEFPKNGEFLKTIDTNKQKKKFKKILGDK